MKILVTVKSVADPDQPLTLNAGGTGLDKNVTSHILNPFDAIAVEQAVRMREGGLSVEEIIVVGIGGAESEKTLRTALAMGADRAIWVETETNLDPWNVAQVLRWVVRSEEPDLLLMGKQAVDDDSNQVGQLLAAILGYPQATFVSRLEMLDEGRLKIQREVDEGLETLELNFPAVVTCDLRLNEPRYVSLPAIMKAKRKPLEKTHLSETGLSVATKLEVLSLEKVSSKRECQFVETIEELIGKLRDEAKVSI